jgi:hypothetical protein
MNADLRDILLNVIDPALLLLPVPMRSDRARLMLLTIGLQESRFVYRRQIKGPARGFWQFELGTSASRGGVWGVYLHPRTRFHLHTLCEHRVVKFAPGYVFDTLERDDVLAAGVARLLLWSDPAPLPAENEPEKAWELYLRTWRPGKPHPETWPALHARAVKALADFRVHL